MGIVRSCKIVWPLILRILYQVNSPGWGAGGGGGYYGRLFHTFHDGRFFSRTTLLSRYSTWATRDVMYSFDDLGSKVLTNSEAFLWKWNEIVKQQSITPSLLYPRLILQSSVELSLADGPLPVCPWSAGVREAGAGKLQTFMRVPRKKRKPHSLRTCPQLKRSIPVTRLKSFYVYKSCQSLENWRAMCSVRLPWNNYATTTCFGFKVENEEII